MTITTRKPLLSRKDIASLIDPDMKTDQVRRNEKRWGLDKARCDLNCRAVRYRALMALRILRALGFFE